MFGKYKKIYSKYFHNNSPKTDYLFWFFILILLFYYIIIGLNNENCKSFSSFTELLISYIISLLISYLLFLKNLDEYYKPNITNKILIIYVIIKIIITINLIKKNYEIDIFYSFLHLINFLLDLLLVYMVERYTYNNVVQ